MLHMSEAKSYYFSTSEISGGLYHREPTWLERLLFLFNRSDFLPESLWATASLISSFELGFWMRCLRMLSLILLLLPLPLPTQLSGKDLDSPKSQSLILQAESIKIFAGFKSLWMTLALCTNFKAQSKLYKICMTWVSVRLIFGI
jgi:hypothetical protein